MMMHSRQNNPTIAYFITFTCYGARLHGDKKGTVDRFNNIYGEPYINPDPLLNNRKIKRMRHSAYLLNEQHRGIVLSSIIDTCEHFEWHLFTVHVRSNHVHVVTIGVQTPEFIMNQLKARASKKLNSIGTRDLVIKRWARHGSTRYLTSHKFLIAAIRYVVYDQGKAMSVYYDRDYDIGEFY